MIQPHQSALWKHSTQEEDEEKEGGVQCTQIVLLIVGGG